MYIHLYSYLYSFSYLHLYLYLYMYLYLHEKEIIKLLINFSEFFASFPCTRNRNRIPNTVPVPVPKSPNEYSSDRFRFRLRLRNPGTNVQIFQKFAFLRCLDDLQFICIFHKQSGFDSGSEIKVKAGSEKNNFRSKTLEEKEERGNIIR